MVLLLVTPLVLIGGAVWGCRTLHRQWFTDNRHLVLQRLDVISSGYWNGRGDELAERLDLKPGTEMFRINLAEMRRALENIPCIIKAEIRRELPGTLRIKLTERVPRAYLGGDNSPFVVDENGVVMLRDESNVGKRRLPFIKIIGMTKNPAPGQIVKEAAPALAVIMLTKRDFPSCDVYAVLMRGDDTMRCLLKYKRFKSFQWVTVPTTAPDMARRFDMLENAIIEYLRRGDRPHEFDLSCDGKVLLVK